MSGLKAIYAFAREMYPKTCSEHLSYGTAGFRGRADNLDSCMYRMGLLATLRSRYLKGAIVGVMITASHNPEHDNGIKLIDPEGTMLDYSWEIIATKLVNVTDNALEGEINRIVFEHQIDMLSSSSVYIGMDNRYHSPRLLKAVEDGVISIKGSVKSFGIVTTPMLHYLVFSANNRGNYGEPTEEGYYKKLITAFQKLSDNNLAKHKYINKIIFDGANGVGALKLMQLLKRMTTNINIDIFNSGNGKINEKCGADFVKLHQSIPDGVTDVKPYSRCVSVDGDADRIVYFSVDMKNKFILLDGDRIATLIAEYLLELVEESDLSLSIGVVQTAYANGGSTNFIKSRLNLPVICVRTGVKYLHEKAKEFDIGIYFESNGHGTVLFSKNAKKQIFSRAQSKVGVIKFQHIINLINETVGDAICDMLLVEHILKEKDLDIAEWFSKYEDLPYLQVKVKVEDRFVIKTSDDDRICLEPHGLQEKIDFSVQKYKDGRAFVRASGTENLVRVYAEAKNKRDAELLAYEIADLTHLYCGGVGAKPSELMG